MFLGLNMWKVRNKVRSLKKLYTGIVIILFASLVIYGGLVGFFDLKNDVSNYKANERVNSMNFFSRVGYAVIMTEKYSIKFELERDKK